MFQHCGESQAMRARFTFSEEFFPDVVGSHPVAGHQTGTDRVSEYLSMPRTTVLRKLDILIHEGKVEQDGSGLALDAARATQQGGQSRARRASDAGLLQGSLQQNRLTWSRSASVSKDLQLTLGTVRSSWRSRRA
jgi:hypothetical protein